MNTNSLSSIVQEYEAQYANPIQENEYVALKVPSQGLNLKILHRGFDYQAAKSFCQTHNFGTKHQPYSLRVMLGGKLHHVDCKGTATKQSKEQVWKISLEHYQMHHCGSFHEFLGDYAVGIEVCSCSYPVFWIHERQSGENKGAITFSSPYTCLVEDNGQPIDYCPNCHAPLFEEVEAEE